MSKLGRWAGLPGFTPGHAVIDNAVSRAPFQRPGAQLQGCYSILVSGLYVIPQAGDGEAGWQAALAQIHAESEASKKALAVAQENDPHPYRDSGAGFETWERHLDMTSG
jgi:hypothetical protein